MSDSERSGVLAALLATHPDLLAEAEREAHRLLDAVDVEVVADDVTATLADIPLEVLGARAGRVRGRGYVHENEAAWELVTEAIDPFRADLRRRAEAGSTDASARVTAGILIGLHRLRDPEDGSVLAYAGPDCPSELAREILYEADRLDIPIDEMDATVHRWLDLD